MLFRSVKCVMIGYSANHAGDTYRLYNTETKKVVNSRNVQWADWHGISQPTDGMIEFDSNGSGIDEMEITTKVVNSTVTVHSNVL